MTRRTSTVLGVSLVLGAAAPAAPHPASAASSTIVGSGTWALVLTIPLYPCTGTGLLAPGDVTGWFVGSVTATVGSTTYTATWPSGSAKNVVVNGMYYTEGCGTVPALPPDNGNANGTVNIVGGTLLKNGQPAGSATLTAYVDWARTESAVTVVGSSVALLDGSGSTLAAAQSAGAGAGVFGAPVPTTVGNPPPNCLGHEEAVQVVAAGTYAQPS